MCNFLIFDFLVNITFKTNKSMKVDASNANAKAMPNRKNATKLLLLCELTILLSTINIIIHEMLADNRETLAMNGSE
ncbi:MAG: hypothetical protein IPF62_03525 [Bacteroidetes bacterium]|nr:hypothetical protein [Bacteroidota bacterium]